MKKRISLLVALMILLSSAITAHADADETHYMIYHGYHTIWSNSAGEWVGKGKPGETVNLPVFQYLPSDAWAVKVHYFTPDFDYEDGFKNVSMIAGGYTSAFDNDQQEGLFLYEDEVYQHSAEPVKMENVVYTSHLGTVTADNYVTLQPNSSIANSSPYDLKDTLKWYKTVDDQALKDYILDEIYRRFGDEIVNDFIERANGNFSDKVEGLAYTIPLILEYKLGGGICPMCGDPTKAGLACDPDTCGKWQDDGGGGCGCQHDKEEEKEEEKPDVPVPDPSADCNAGTITWSEVGSHKYYCKSSGCGGHVCNHVYTYQTTLSSSASISPETFKSGYGFETTVNNSINTKQIRNSGKCGDSISRNCSQTPAPPTAVDVTTGWIVKNKLGTQSSTVTLAKTASTATTSKFQAPANKISEIKANKIYTPVELAGTAQKPAKHTVTYKVYGGGVAGQTFCKTFTKTITINGNMYEDDWSVDRLR